jgi:hypothetical protein
MSLSHHSLVAWQRPDDLFIKLHQLSLKAFPALTFLNISQSSLAEMGYCLHVARRLGYISEAVEAELEIEIKQVGAPLAGLIRSMRWMIGSEVAGAVLLIGY